MKCPLILSVKIGVPSASKLCMGMSSSVVTGLIMRAWKMGGAVREEVLVEVSMTCLKVVRMEPSGCLLWEDSDAMTGVVFSFYLTNSF